MQYCQSLQAIYQQLNEWDDAIRVTRRLLEHREQTMLPDDPESVAGQIGARVLFMASVTTPPAPSRC